MLSRVTVRRSYASLIRSLSDKPGDADKNVNPLEPEKKDTKTNDTSSTDKIQALLKSMIAENKAREEESKNKFSTAPGIYRKEKSKPDTIHAKEEKIEESIVTAAGEVAAALGGDVKQTESDLLSKVLGKITQSPTNLSDLIIGMKIDRSKESDDIFKTETRGQQVKRLVEKSKMRSEAGQHSRFSQRNEHFHRAEKQETRSVMPAPPIDIFNADALGIFKATPTYNYGTKLATWEELQERELKLSISQPPANYFQKMILWTQQGKVWKFPINNEQGMEDEEKVHFSEHVFLETQLEGWCPKKGPIRHFMELVCVGLSKNPFYTAQEKKDHIVWYKEYFESKQSLLAEIGALDNPSEVKKQPTT